MVSYRWPIPQSDAFPAEDCIVGKAGALLVDDFQLATWGMSSTPLLTTSSNGRTRLILNTCSDTTTLLALEPKTLAADWRGKGNGSGYASCIEGTFGGRRQIIGYDSVSLGGWDFETGVRLWNLRPPVKGDFNVPTPIAVSSDRLLVVSEGNGMRLYAFNDQGLLLEKPVAENDDIANDTVTPVVVAGKAYCTSDGAICQADVNEQLHVPGRWLILASINTYR